MASSTTSTATVGTPSKPKAPVVVRPLAPEDDPFYVAPYEFPAFVTDKQVTITIVGKTPGTCVASPKAVALCKTIRDQVESCMDDGGETINVTLMDDLLTVETLEMLFKWCDYHYGKGELQNYRQEPDDLDYLDEWDKTLFGNCDTHQLQVLMTNANHLNIVPDMYRPEKSKNIKNNENPENPKVAISCDVIQVILARFFLIKIKEESSKIEAKITPDVIKATLSTLGKEITDEKEFENELKDERYVASVKRVRELLYIPADDPDNYTDAECKETRRSSEIVIEEHQKKKPETN